MGFWADGLIQGQAPRKNGCICAYALIPLLGGPILAALAAGYGLVQVIT